MDEYVDKFEKTFWGSVKKNNSVVFTISWTMKSETFYGVVMSQVRSMIECASRCVEDAACTGFRADRGVNAILCHRAMSDVDHVVV